MLDPAINASTNTLPAGLALCGLHALSVAYGTFVYPKTRKLHRPLPDQSYMLSSEYVTFKKRLEDCDR
jgi:hypothetical protein